MTNGTPDRMRIAFHLVTVALVLLLFTPAVRADPVVGAGGGLRKTLVWSMSDTTGLDLASTAVEKGSAVLTWIPETVNWSRGSDYAENGNLTPGLIPNSTGVELAADGRNHLADGDFSTPGPWEFLPTQNVSVVEDGGLEDAYIGHASPAVPLAFFSTLDEVNDPRWNSTGSSGSGCIFVWISPGRNGTGSKIQCTITLGPPGSFAGLEWQSANWSAYDHLLLWIRTVDQQSWSFRLGATVSGLERLTTPQPLTVGWQEIAVDLNELGADRSALTYVHFLVVGDSVLGKIVDFDDIRLAKAKSFEETGRLRQEFSKLNVTSASSGSANLAFDYWVVGNIGVEAFDLAVNFSGGDGSYVRAIPPGNGGPSNRYVTDVSSIATAAGLYRVEFSVRIRVATIGGSNAAVRIDNVSMVFPNRSSGSFLSRVMDFGLTSRFAAVRWSGTIPSATAAVLKIRSGNETNPDGPTWSPWRTWDALGAYSPNRGPSRYLQVGLDLNTLNASRTPVVTALQIDVVHRASTGSIETSWDPEGTAFESWESMGLEATVPSGASILLYVQRQGMWVPVQSGEAFASSVSPKISWRVLLTTSHGLITPELSSVVLTYRVPWSAGELAGIFMQPYVLGALVAVVLGVSAYRTIARRAFAVDDLFLITREGRLMMHNTRRMRPDRDEDILSGMLTAILAFVKDSDPESNGELHQFKVGDKTTVLEKGQHSYVAATYSGRVPPWAARDVRRFLKDLEARFGDAFARWSGDPEDLQGLKEFTARFVSRTRYRPPNDAKGRPA